MKEKLTFTTTGCWDETGGFGCASLGLPGVCGNDTKAVIQYAKELDGQVFTGSYQGILDAVAEFVHNNSADAAIVLFGNVGGENAFLKQLQKYIHCPIVGGAAAIDAATGRSGLIPGNGDAAVFLITDDGYTYEAVTQCIHEEILEECILTFSDPRTILTINGVDALTYYREKKASYGLKETDFEHMTLSDMRNINAHMSAVDGALKSGRDVEEKMLLRYVPHEKVYPAMRAFYDDPDAIICGCAGLSGLLDHPLDTQSFGLFLFGEVCTVNGIAEFGNLMLSKLVVRRK